MEVQIIITVRGEAPNVETIGRALHKVLDDKVTASKGLITSFVAREIRPGSEFNIQFPESLDA